jgi:hypothetical protein
VTTTRKSHRVERRVEPVRITTAPLSHREDLDKRRRRYVISMMVRSACFVGAVVVGDNWLRWVLVAAAVFLPYVAVVVANSAAPRVEGSDLVTGGAGHRELG